MTMCDYIIIICFVLRLPHFRVCKLYYYTLCEGQMSNNIKNNYNTCTIYISYGNSIL